MSNDTETSASDGGRTPGAAGPGPDRLALAQTAIDLGAGGPRLALRLQGNDLTVPLTDWGLGPQSLLSVQSDPQPGERVPYYPSLARLLTHDAPVTCEGVAPEKPRQHLENLLIRVRCGLDAWFDFPQTELGIVHASHLTETNRLLLLRTGHNAGWRSVRLLNRSTALAVHTLQGRPPGSYLILALGHGPADASIVRWNVSGLRVLAHLSDDRFSGENLDRRLIASAVERSERKLNRPISTEVYSDADWLFLRRQAEAVRWRLNVFDRVALHLPGTLTESEPIDVLFDRREWIQTVLTAFSQIGEFLHQCAGTAELTLEQLAGCIVAGGLTMQAGVLGGLTGCRGLPALSVASPESFLRGALLLMSQEGQEASRAELAPADLALPPRPKDLEFAHVRPPPLPATESRPLQGAADTIIERVLTLTRSGRAAEARAQLLPLKRYVEALELGLADPSEALQALAAASPLPVDAPPPAAPPRVDPTSDTQAPRDSTPDPAAAQPVRTGPTAQRRKYLRAREDILKAEQFLKEGRLKESVGYSHLAYKVSQDPRIVQAMIEVHLRAAGKRPPQPQNFEEEKTWLACALNDDPANERVQRALVQRCQTQARQLAELGDFRSRKEAISVLNDLALTFPMAEFPKPWVRILRDAPPGSVKLE